MVGPLARDAPVARDRSVEPSAERAWAQMTIGGVGDVEGDVIDFSGRHVVVAFDQPVRGAVTREALLTLGVGSERGGGFVATITEATETSDGRPCLVMALQEGNGHERRRSRRLPFANKVDMLIVRGAAGSDARVPGIALNLAPGGIAVRSERSLPVRTEVLLRFRVPPVRGATVQVRGVVVSCRPDPDSGWMHGVRFDRVSGHAAQQLRTAIKTLSDIAG